MSHENDDPHARRVRDLPCWSGPVALEPLAGGITNRNYLVVDGEERYVARCGEELPFLGIDRRNERLCHREAERLGVAPRLTYAKGGALVSLYIASRTMDADSSREPGFPDRVAEALARLHRGRDAVEGDLMFFSPFQVNRTYVSTSRERGAILPDDIDEMMTAQANLDRSLTPYVPALCHNDMLPANVLDDGDRVWIVDWEYAGMGRPLFDLAGFSVNCRFSDEEDRTFLTAYRGGLFREEDLHELHVLKAASLLREALWSVVQTVASDLDFDYAEYARIHFEKFRRALAHL